MTFVKANGGYIFGGYNPLSWLSDFLYSETDESYLFQVFNPTLNEEEGPTNIGLLKDDPAFNQVEYHTKNPAVS